MFTDKKSVEEKNRKESSNFARDYKAIEKITGEYSKQL